MMFDGIELWLGLLFLAVGIGFGWGRRWGRRDGFLEGVRFAPLELRRASLERAHCIICGRGAIAPSEQNEQREQKEPRDKEARTDLGPDTAADAAAQQITGRTPQFPSSDARRALDNGDESPL